MERMFQRIFIVVVMIIVMPAVQVHAIGGSIGDGDISVFKDGRLVEKLTGKNPVENGALLVCSSPCTIKSVGIVITPDTGVPFAVTNMEDTYNLFVKEGTVNFLLSSGKRKVAFFTPSGKYTTAEPVVLEDGFTRVSGSFTVEKDEDIDISIDEGKMLFTTENGLKTVDEGNTITTAINPAAPSTQGALALKEAGMAAAGFAATTVTLTVLAEETSDDGPSGGAPVIPPSESDSEPDSGSDSASPSS